MLYNVFDVVTLKGLLESWEYKIVSVDYKKSLQTFEHKKLKTIVVKTSGSYTRNQIMVVVANKMGIYNYDQFKKIFEDYRSATNEVKKIFKNK